MQKDFSASYTHDPPLSILSPLISRSIRTPISHSLYPISDFREGPIKFLATDPQFATRRSLDKGIKREFSLGQIDLPVISITYPPTVTIFVTILEADPSLTEEDWP